MGTNAAAFMSRNGKRGGKAVLKKYGPEHFSKLAKRGHMLRKRAANSAKREKAARAKARRTK